MAHLVEIFDLIDSLTSDNAVLANQLDAGEHNAVLANQLDAGEHNAVLANQLDAGEHNAADVAEKVKVLIDANFPSIRKPSAESLVDAVKFSPKEVKDLGIMVLGNYTEAVDDDERLDIISSLYALMLQLDTSTTK